MPTTSLH